MEKVGSILSSTLRDLNLEERVAFESLRQRWQTLFKEPLSCHIFPAAFRDGELLINVDSPAWLQQVKFFKKEIIERLGDLPIKDIRFRHGRVHEASHENSGDKKTKGSKEVRELPESDILWIGQTVSTIGDPDLREDLKKTIEKAIRKSIKRSDSR